MIEERIWELLSLKLSGEATDAELAELEQLITQRPGASVRFDTLRKIWSTAPPGVGNKEQAFNRHLQRLSNHLSDPVLSYEEPVHSQAIPDNPEPNLSITRPLLKKPVFWLITAAAASVLLFFAVNRFASNEKIAPSLTTKNTVSTKPGSKSKITLSDGTVVLLNAGSNITYDQVFDANKREIQLSGEAYFDVTHDPGRPFIIHTNSVDIRVLGTAFNVRSYPNEKTTETSLIRGSVEISVHNNPDKKIILKPSEKLVVTNNLVETETATNSSNDNSKREELAMMTLSKIFLNRRDSTSKETQWIKDRLVFEEEKLGKILTDLERLYNIQMVIKNERIKKVSITGDFENKSLHEIMEALKIAAAFNYSQNENSVTIW